jgi:hypothetical protein
MQVVEPPAGAEMLAHLEYARAQSLHITEAPKLRFAKPQDQTPLGSPVPDAVEP